MLTHNERTKDEPTASEFLLGRMEGESGEECYNRMMDRLRGSAKPAKTLEAEFAQEIDHNIIAAVVSGYSPKSRWQIKQEWFDKLDDETRISLHYMMNLYGYNNIVEMFDHATPEGFTKTKQRIAALEPYSLWESYKNA